ncbi:MAG: FAD-dependent monooxygenase [Anaerolineae bacterium]|nr:FAD-dependent monooxygenase [Anaerolineae bacterium]
MSQASLMDVVIVGAGPAGLSTALHLVQADPSWAGRVMVLDKAVHPREKLCGGGITRLGEDVLKGLGLSVEPPHVPVREIRFIFGNQVYAIHDDPVFRVVRRDEFDHWLALQAEGRGVIVRQGEAVKAVTPHADYVEIITEQMTFYPKVVVGADGSRSFVRQALKWDDGQRIARLLEVLTPEVANEREEFCKGVAVFDFSRMLAGLQGYYWDFPSLVEGQPVMNRGVFDSRARPERSRAALKQVLREALAKRNRNLADYGLKGHPLHWFDPHGRFAIPHIILAGDAAGVDPMLGEGISFALAYGEAAAAAIVDAFACQNFGFADYRERILAHPILSQLRLRTIAARIAYRFKSPRLVRWLWQLAPLIVRGMAWYKPDCIPVNDRRLIRVNNEPE